MYSVQVRHGNRWINLSQYEPRSWNSAVQLFTEYMYKFVMHDYRIVPVIDLPKVKK